MKNRLMELVEATQLKKDVAPFTIGDQVEVHQLILEGEKQRTQVFAGVVIAMKGDGMREMFTVRRIVQGEGVERMFPLNSPKIAKIEVKRTGAVRRAKLYYLREAGRQSDSVARTRQRQVRQRRQGNVRVCR